MLVIAVPPCTVGVGSLSDAEVVAFLHRVTRVEHHAMQRVGTMAIPFTLKDPIPIKKKLSYSSNLSYRGYFSDFLIFLKPPSSIDSSKRLTCKIKYWGSVSNFVVSFAFVRV